ncbi:beta-lactamase class A [Rhodoferax sp. OV413]|uniref:class A beta-lactamase n=1 Tax=Rhodoferax sp. OV413 TaxID=1855285 RepID=UPI000884B5A4|nr:class A beta-lactamase [Rhodoferax sp. OV413]SDP39043.1 beta-lactamase class A [Rhodoferax sp. OV413]
MPFTTPALPAPVRRRSLLLAAAASPFLPVAAAAPSASQQLQALETAATGRLGVAAFGAGGASLLHRAEERFPACSTFKLLLASAILARSAQDPGLLQQRIRYTAADLVSYSPITEKHVADGQTVAELCAAALQYSDNSASNLLMRTLGGPPAVTAYAHAIGDTSFRLDRWETDLNSAIPGDTHDTCTPAGMARSLQTLLLGDALALPQRTQLKDWMLGNTTGATRIRAGVPADWRVADKTGAGSYGTTNDIGVVWSPAGTPVVLAVYFTQPDKGAPMRNDVVAATTRIAVQALV